jgi:3-hydroxymyristoyl/3-hydroxydecanoyl-(acyl carrier protein) dehydratase
MSRHAHPFRQIDRVLSMAGDRCTAVKLVGGGEVLRDEAGRPGVYPPALVVEALAQAALPLAGGAGAGKSVAADAPPGMIVAMDRVRLHRPVVAGDRLVLTAVIAARLGGLVRVESRAEVAGKIVAEGEFTIVTGPGRSGAGPSEDGPGGDPA